MQDSQVTLLQLADKHQAPLPLQHSDYLQRLQLLAAQKEVEAVEAQLAASGGPGVAAEQQP